MGGCVFGNNQKPKLQSVQSINQTNKYSQILSLENELKQCNQKIQKINQEYLNDALLVELDYLEQQRQRLQNQLSKYKFMTSKCARIACSKIAVSDFWKGSYNHVYCSEQCYYKVMPAANLINQSKNEKKHKPINVSVPKKQSKPNNSYKEQKKQFKPTKCALTTCQKIAKNNFWKGSYNHVYCSEKCYFKVMPRIDLQNL